MKFLIAALFVAVLATTPVFGHLALASEIHNILATTQGGVLALGAVAVAPLIYANDDEVLTFREWCSLNKISERTGQRILHSGNGPVVTELSAKRIGITRRHNREWQASRARTA
jgi:hypothetical protein